MGAYFERTQKINQIAQGNRKLAGVEEPYVPR